MQPVKPHGAQGGRATEKIFFRQNDAALARCLQHPGIPRQKRAQIPPHFGQRRRQRAGHICQPAGLYQRGAF